MFKKHETQELREKCDLCDFGHDMDVGNNGAKWSVWWTVDLLGSSQTQHKEKLYKRDRKKMSVLTFRI